MQGDGVASGEAGVRGPMPGGGTDVATRAGVPRCGGEGGAREAGGPLTLDRLIAWRREGLSYPEIGKIVGKSEYAVGRYARKYLGPGALRRRVMELLDAGWADRTGVAIAAEVGCSTGLVYDVKREIRGCEERKCIREGQRCRRCEFYEEPRNPVGEDGLCLWCRLEGQGIDLLAFHESGAALALLGARRLGR